MYTSRNIPVSEQAGFALLMALILTGVTAIIIIGFLGHAANDRVTAEVGGERYRAELAAQSGLEAAKKALAAMSPAPSPSPPISKSQNDYFIVTTSTDSNGVPYYFIGSADGGSVGAPTAQYYPLYSGGTVQSGLSVSATPVPSPTPNPTIRAQQTFPGPSPTPTPLYYPRLFSSAPHSTWRQNINTSWQIVDNTIPTTAEHARFTYWIEDLAGYVDANVAGNTDGGGLHTRPTGTAPSEVALFTLFATTAQSDPGGTWAAGLVGEHGLLFTPWTTRVGVTGGANSTSDQAAVASLVANLSTDSEQNIIPFGLGYANQGQVKTNLNSIIKNSPNDPGVTQIATAISTNLPNFASTRKGGLLSTQDYNKTIAANIISYAQPATNPPLCAASYRGIGPYPFVVEFCDKFEWTMPSGGAPNYYIGADGNYCADVTVTTFVQVWNMSNVNIASGQLRFVDLNKTGMQIVKNNGKSDGYSLTSFDAMDTPQGQSWRPWQTILDFSQPTPTPTPNPTPAPPKPPAPSSTPIIGAGTLHANEYRVFQIASRTYTYDSGSTTDPSRGASHKWGFGLKTDVTSTDTLSSYQVYWKASAGASEVLVDQPPSGLTRNSWGSKDGVSGSWWDPNHYPGPEFHTTMPGLRYSSGNAAPFLLGDPRGNYYIQASQSDIPYAITSWWGRVTVNSSPSPTPYAGTQRITGWSDGGHNTTYPGPSPSSSSQLPTAVPTPTPDPIAATKAPARMSNAGQFSSITELSYIYDPFQWNPFTAAPTSAVMVDTAWQSTWKNKFQAADSTYGSHSTLRIGRPEHASFSQGPTPTPAPAWQLLDIFSAGDPSASPTPNPLSNQISTRGKININTASFEVLRTLGAGIQIGNLNASDVDQAIQPSTVYGPIGLGPTPTPSPTPVATPTPKPADRFANAVLNFRKTQPFISTSQLSLLTATDKNKNANQPLFGNVDQYVNGDGPTVQSDGSYWNDAASEEYFAKIFNFTTVRSRNFRVFVTGQVYIPQNGSQPERVIATANKVYHVFLNPTRNQATGAITSQTCQVTYSADVF